MDDHYNRRSHAAMRVMATAEAQGRSPRHSRECEVQGCPHRTSDGKPYCHVHVLLNAYAARVARLVRRHAAGRERKWLQKAALSP